MATFIRDDYFDYVEMLKKCHGGDLKDLTVEDVRVAQDAVKTSPIADGFFKIGTMTIERTAGVVRDELIELNRLIDEIKK